MVAVSWKSSKQQTVADLVTEVEYIAASKAAKKAIWMKKIISELNVVPGIEQSMPLYCANTGVVAQAKEPKSHHKSKHILRWFHLVQEIVEKYDMIMERVDIKNNIANSSLRSCWE